MIIQVFYEHFQLTISQGSQNSCWTAPRIRLFIFFIFFKSGTEFRIEVHGRPFRVKEPEFGILAPTIIRLVYLGEPLK